MSYGVAAALQVAIYEALVAALPGVAIHDAVPEGGGAGTWVLIGPEEALDASDKTGGGAEHRLVISVITDAEGFLGAKEMAVSISDALVGARPVLSRGRVVDIRFRRANALRLNQGKTRRIDLRLTARVED